jgi:hypothetical protein
MQLPEPHADCGKNKRKRRDSLTALGSLPRMLDSIVTPTALKLSSI